MGVWFDTRPAAAIDRFWLYGTNFVYMLDMSQDLSPSSKQDTAMVKVGRLGQHVLEVAPDHALVKLEESETKTSRKRKRNKASGAGGEMRKDQKYSAQVRRTTDGINDADVDMGLLSPPRSLNLEDDDEDNDDMDLDEEQENALVATRRKEEHQAGQRVDMKADFGPASWHTFQYRGIFGACALQPQSSPEGEDEQGDDGSALEVVIVERPMFDVEFVPRFTSGQDW